MSDTVKKPLFIIKDKAGNQVSTPNEDDSELWDRVDGMDPDGRKGWRVVAYKEKELTEAVSSGVYSILNNTWLLKPDKIYAQSEDVSDQVAKLVDEANKCKSIESIDAFLDGIYKLRQEGLLKNGEGSDGNVIFKELRSNGTMQKLKDLKVKLLNDLMSLG